MIASAGKELSKQHRIAASYSLVEIAETNQKIEQGGFCGGVVVDIE